MADVNESAKMDGLNKRYPEAYKLMLGFYCDPAFYNSSPDCRPADNVLMAIQYVLEGRASKSASDLAWRLERIIDDGGPLTLSDKAILCEAAASLGTRAAPPAMDREAVIEECAQIADNHVAMGYMSGRERDYCHEHGDEIAQKIRALSTLSADAIRQGEGIESTVRLAVWNAAKKKGVSDEAAMATVEAVVAELPATPASHASDGGEA